MLREMRMHDEVISFADGDIVMDYGQSVRTMPIIMKVSVKMLGMEENGKEQANYRILLFSFLLSKISPEQKIMF